MIKRIILLAIVIALTQSKFTIVSPQALAEQLGDDIGYSLANYGNTPYGSTFYGVIAIPDPLNGCQSISSKYDLKSEDMEESQFNQNNSIVYLIQRGECSFVNKSRNAQNSNGKVVIIFNDKQNEGVNDIILMDQFDHSGQGLMISTIFVAKQTGDTILNYINNNQDILIRLKVEFQRPQGKDKNKVKFWMSSMDLSSYQFLENFHNHYLDLKNDNVDIDFTPHYITQSDNDVTKQKEHCISRGKYCNPEFQIGGNDLHNREVVLEDLRQILLFQLDQEAWWKYILLFKKNCVQKQVVDISECSERAIAFSGLTPNLLKNLQASFSESFIPKSTSDDEYAINDNQIFETEKKKQYYQSVSILPTLIFNGDHFRGDLTQDSAIYEYICAPLKPQPESCFDSYREWKEFKSKKIFQEKSSSQSQIRVGMIIFIIFVVLALMLIIIFILRRMVKKEINESMGSQVNLAISNYFALNDSQTPKKNIK
ncbi:hypothetical protein ABPG72_016826 [Tetrahymena utriculariae]